MALGDHAIGFSYGSGAGANTAPSTCCSWFGSDRKIAWNRIEPHFRFSLIRRERGQIVTTLRRKNRIAKNRFEQFS